MKKIELQKTFTIQKRADPFGDALTEWYGKPLYWLYRKYNRARVERAFDLAQKENDHTFINLMQRIHHS
jgi:hypothetical protein